MDTVDEKIDLLDQLTYIDSCQICSSDNNKHHKERESHKKNRHIDPILNLFQFIYNVR